MGRIGPSQQRFEVLPAPAWTLADLADAWERDAAAPRDITSQPDPAQATERPEAPSER